MRTVLLLRDRLCIVILSIAAASGAVQPLLGMGQPPTQGDNPQATADTPATETTEGAALAKDVIARMDQAYYRLWQDRVTGFDAVYDVNEDGLKLGTLQVLFTVDANGGHFKSKLQEDSPTAQTLRAMLENAWLESLFKTFSTGKASASRTGDSFRIYYREPQEDIRLRTLTISNDYRLEHEYEAGKDLSSDKLEFTVQTIDGK